MYLLNVRANSPQLMQDKNSSNCLETKLIKANFTHLCSKYNKLLGELIQAKNFNIRKLKDKYLKQKNSISLIDLYFSFLNRKQLEGAYGSSAPYPT